MPEPALWETVQLKCVSERASANDSYAIQIDAHHENDTQNIWNLSKCQVFRSDFFQIRREITNKTTLDAHGNEIELKEISSIFDTSIKIISTMPEQNHISMR